MPSVTTHFLETKKKNELFEISRWRTSSFKIHTVEEHSTGLGLWLTISFPLQSKPKHLDTAPFLLQKNF